MATKAQRAVKSAIRKGASIKRIARAAGRSESTIYAIARGAIKKPPVKVLRKIIGIKTRSRKK